MNVRWTTLACLSVLTLGCGGGGGGGSSASGAAAAAVGSGNTAVPTPTAPTPTNPGTTAPDADAPEITLATPTRGEHTTQSSILVSGTITDQSAISFFLINGVAATINTGGSFNEVIPLTTGLNTIELHASDAVGNQVRTVLPVVSGQFLPETQAVADAVVARLNRPAFDAIEQVAAQQLGGQDLTAAIMNQNPLFASNVTVASIEVNATGATFGTPTLDLDPQTGGLFVRAVLPQIDVRTRATGRVIGIPYSTSVSVTADRATVEALAVVTVLPTGALDTQLTQVSVALDNFRYNVGGIPGFLESLTRNAVRGLIEDQVRDQVASTVPATINQAIANANQPITQTVLGHTVSLTVLPQVVAFDTEGLSVLSGADMTVSPKAGFTPPASPGSLFTPNPAPAYGLTPSFHLGVNDDLLNRMGHALWRSGALTFTVDQQRAQTMGLPSWVQLDAFLLTIFFPSLATQVNPADPLELELTVEAPPLFKTLTAPNLLEVGLGDLTLSVYVAPAGRPRQLVLRTHTQLRAGVGLTVDPATQTVQIQLAGTPTILTDVADQPMIPLDAFAVESFMDFLLPPMGNLVLAQWAGIPLPTVPGVNLRNLDALPDGPGGDFITIRGDM